MRQYYQKHIQITRSKLSLAITFAITNLAMTPLAMAMDTNAKASQDTSTMPTATLDTLIVTASSGGITPTVNQQVIEKSNIIDMKDVLKDQPSLSVSGGNGIAQQLYLRNFGENELTFSVDDASPNAQIFHHQSRFMFDPVLLKSMNIEKGTGTASSGIGVTAGAIRMTTVNANDMLSSKQNVGAMIGGGYSSNKGYQGVLAAYGRSGKQEKLGSQFDGIIMGNYVNQENYKDGYNQEIPNTAMRQEGYMAKFGWDINQTNRLEISHRREKTSGDLGLRPNLLGTFGKQPIMDTKITQDTSSINYQGYNLAGKTGLDGQANIYHSEISDHRKRLDNPHPRFPETFDVHAKTTGGNASVSLPIMERHTLEAGLNYRKGQTSTANYTKGSGVEDKTDTGVFAEMKWDFDPISLTTGVRYDHYDITNNTGTNLTGSLVSPSITGKWQINDNLSINGSWTQAMQSPRLYDALILSLGWADNHIFANDLKPAKAQTTEVGFEWKADNGFMLDANIFDQRIKDYIRSETVEKENQKHSIEFINVQTNSGLLKNKGYEVNLGYKKDGIRGYLGMSHSDPKLNGEYYGFALDVMPTGTKYNASLSYQFDNPRLEIGVKHHYVSSYDYQEKSIDRKTKVETIQNRNLPSYWTADVFANWQPFANDKLSINAGINNITNQQYYNQSNFRASRITNSNLNPEKGREFRVGLHYKF